MSLVCGHVTPLLPFSMYFHRVSNTVMLLKVSTRCDSYYMVLYTEIRENL